MKKLIAVSILLALLSTAAFAQFKVGFSLDALTDVVHTKSYLGDFKDSDVYHLGPGTVDTLTNRSYWDDNEMRLKLLYSNDNISAEFQIRGDEFVGNRVKDDATSTSSIFNSDRAGGRTFYKGDVRFGDLWENTFGDYWIIAKAGKVSAYIGNTAQRGATNSFRFAQNEMLKNRVQDYGLFVPTFSPSKGVLKSFSFTNYEGNNTAKLVGTGTQPHVDFNFNLDPLTVTLAGSLKEDKANEGGDKIGLMARVSGNKVADKINFDVTYQIAGGDPTRKSDAYYVSNKFGPNQIEDGLPADGGDDTTSAAYYLKSSSDKADGKGKWQNSIGVYAGLSLIDNLGIGIGYTGRFLVIEDNPSGNRENLYPLINGIDLRFQFTGVDKLTLTLNNNFSFAATKGTKNENQYSILGAGDITKDLLLDNKQKESYFGMYNMLGVVFKATDTLGINFIASNKAGWYSIDEGSDQNKVTIDQLNILLFAVYKFNANVQFECGPMMDLIHFTSDDRSKGGDKFKAGTFNFGIPVRLLITW